MARIRGIEYEVHDGLGNEQWIQFGDSSNDLAARGYERATEATGSLGSLTVASLTGEDAYLMHVRYVGGLDAVPRVPYDDLPDMAIQMYETEAAIYNDQLVRGEA